MDWVRSLILLAVGIALILLAGVFPYPLSTIAYVVGVIMAIVGAILLLVGLVRGAAPRV
jgi:hypothetical protein